MPPQRRNSNKGSLLHDIEVDTGNPLEDEADLTPPVSPLHNADWPHTNGASPAAPPRRRSPEPEPEPGSPAAVPDGGTGIAPVDWFWMNPENPRDESEFDLESDEELRAMSDTVKVYGIMTPITVVERGAWVERNPEHNDVIPKNVPYVVPLGGTRLWLAEYHGLKELKFSRDDSLAEPERWIEAGLIENRRRRVLHPVKEAQQFQRLKDRGKSQAEIARRTGYSTATISLRLKLLKLIPELASLVRTPVLSEEAAYPLCDLSQEEQRKLLQLGPPLTLDHLAGPKPKPEPKPIPQGLVVRVPVRIPANSSPEDAAKYMEAKIDADVLKEIVRVLSDSLTAETD